MSELSPHVTSNLTHQHSDEATPLKPPTEVTSTCTFHTRAGDESSDDIDAGGFAFALPELGALIAGPIHIPIADEHDSLWQGVTQGLLITYSHSPLSLTLSSRSFPLNNSCLLYYPSPARCHHSPA